MFVQSLLLRQENKEVDRLVLKGPANFVFPPSQHKDFMVIRASDQRQDFIQSLINIHFNSCAAFYKRLFQAG